MLRQYKVLGYDETVENVDILGETRKVGDIVELDREAENLEENQESQIDKLIEDGKLELMEEEEEEEEEGAGDENL